jgi:class 3 adenylate cyclase/tetratricopeptide (TPR) repeat protein
VSVGPSAERKIVTVLFADLAGSTELVQRHDAEQVRALLGAFFEEMTQRIEAFGGTIEKYAGDAIMAVFGVPAVHEDDAERAVRAALAMQQGLAELNPMFEAEYRARLQLRVGIATGEAVGATEAVSQFMVTGEVTNLAARLQTVADGIVVSEATHRLLQPLLEAKPLGSLTLKGFAAPVQAYTVTGLRTIDAKGRGLPGLSSPVVGRDAEVATLARCLDDLGRGRGQIVSIIGEAGIGKSRLKIDLRDGRPAGIQWLEGRCNAYTGSTSYAPFIQVLRATFQLGDSEPAAIARTKLRAGLKSLLGAEHERLGRAIGQLLGVPIEAVPAQPALDPRAFQSQLVVAVKGVLEGVLARSPLALAFEDLHWADAASVELLTALTELTDVAPLMLLVTSRPDAEGKGWDFRFHAQRNYQHRVTEIQLAPLAAVETDRLVANLLRVAEVPPGLRRRILERAEGNPFYLEELIRSLIEAGTLRRDGERWIASDDAAPLSLPDTLRGVIAARIDRLPRGAKTALQRASIIGRFFTYRALRAFGDGDAELERALAQLLRAELVREFSRIPEREYVFKHVLTQEAAYASTLEEERRALHRVFAQYLEAGGGDPDGQPDGLARHWLGAEDWPKALRYTLKAGERARALYARPDAIAHFWKALELLEHLPSGGERDRTHVGVVLSLLPIPGWWKDRAGLTRGLGHLDTALNVAQALGSEDDIAKLECLRGYFSEDEPLLRRALARAEASGAPRTEAFAAEWYGQYLGHLGRYENALSHFLRAIDLLGEAGDRYEQALNITAGGRCYGARAGLLDDSLRYATDFRQIADDLADPRLRAWRAMEAETYMYLGRWGDALRVAEESLPIAWDIREAAVITFASAWAIMACVKLGRLDDAERIADRALRERPATSSFAVSYLHTAVAQLRLVTGQPDAALEAATKAIELADASGFRLEQGAARRVLGEVHDARQNDDEADAAFRQSREILEASESRPELAQTLLAYGRFRARRERAAGAAMIQRALTIFDEIGASGWAEEARAVLARG